MFWTIVAAILIRRPARCCSPAGRQVNTVSTATKTLSHGEGAARNEPRFIFHASFEDPGAEEIYGGVPADNDDASLGFMPDDVTRDCTKSMHYAAWRASGATTKWEAARWRGRYLDCRNRIVLGNRKRKLSCRSAYSSSGQDREGWQRPCSSPDPVSRSLSSNGRPTWAAVLPRSAATDSASTWGRRSSFTRVSLKRFFRPSVVTCVKRSSWSASTRNIG